MGSDFVGVEPQFVESQNAGEFPQGSSDAATGDTCWLGSRRFSSGGCIIGADGCVGWGTVFLEMDNAACNSGNGVSMGEVGCFHGD